MSIKETLKVCSVIEAELDSIEQEKIFLQKRKKAFEAQLLGEIDEEMIRLLPSDKLQVFEVDGTKWYLIPVILLGQRIGQTVRVAVWKWSYPILDGLIDKDVDHKAMQSDAMILTDLKGHRISTRHEWEGHRAVPHWYIDGYIDVKEVERAIKSFTERLCYEQQRE